MLLNISVSNSSRFNAETMAYQVDKGTGIKEMIDHFDIKQEETLVIGDSDNDRAMFEFGGYTVSMKMHVQKFSLLLMILHNIQMKKMAALYLEHHLLN